MKLFWIEHTARSLTLMSIQDTQFQKGKQRRVAYVSPSFTFGNGDIAFDDKWRVRIVITGEVAMFSSLDEAKDWAQAVVLLTH